MDISNYYKRVSGNKVRLERRRSVTETENQRVARLARQARMNGMRVMMLNGFATVTSSQSKVEEVYKQRVDGFNDAENEYIWTCSCPFGTHNVGIACSHTALVRDFTKRSVASKLGHRRRLAKVV
jgi:hypothetical protein